MSTTFENAGHSFTDAGYFKPEDQSLIMMISDRKKNTDKKRTEALSELIALHKREMTDETITMKEWQAAVKKGEEALQYENQEV